MPKILSCDEITEDMVVAYFDLEFCNDMISRHNFPVSIGISYRKGEEEIGTYFSVIDFGKRVQLRAEQLRNIGYQRHDLSQLGYDMKWITQELKINHDKYRPECYVAFGRQDEELLRKHMTEKIDWNFFDATLFLPDKLQQRYDVSLEKYAYICQIEFVHSFHPLEDARTLGKILWCVLSEKVDMDRASEIDLEYEKKIFKIQYQDRQRAYDYLSGLEELTIKQQEKLEQHKIFLAENKRKYEEFFVS